MEPIDEKAMKKYAEEWRNLWYNTLWDSTLHHWCGIRDLKPKVGIGRAFIKVAAHCTSGGVPGLCALYSVPSPRYKTQWASLGPEEKEKMGDMVK